MREFKPVVAPDITKDRKFRSSENYWHRQAGLFSDIYRTRNPFRAAARIFLEQRQAKIETLIRPNSSGAALDVGCGSGEFVAMLAPKFKRVVGADYSDVMLGRARATAAAPNAIYVKADCTRLPFSDGEFDQLFALGLLDYVADMPAAMREFSRVLKQGGTPVVTLPKSPSLFAPLRWSASVRGALFKIPPIVNVLSRAQVEEMAEGADFRILSIDSLWTTMWILQLEKR